MSTRIFELFLRSFFPSQQKKKHSPSDYNGNPIESVNIDMTTRRRESAAMNRAQEDYEEITFEPEKASIHKRDASITTTEDSTTTLSSVEDGSSTTETQYLTNNNNQFTSLSTSTETSPSVEKYPYSESIHPTAHLVSITTNPPPAAAFSPSQIDYLHHRQPPIPFCYELNGNLRYVSNQFQPKAVWSSMQYYYNDPYISSLVYRLK